MQDEEGLHGGWLAWFHLGQSDVHRLWWIRVREGDGDVGQRDQLAEEEAQRRQSSCKVRKDAEHSALWIENGNFRLDRKAVTETKKDEEEAVELVQVNEMSSWNESKVRQFLLKCNLTAMVPLCANLNGAELINMYAMCQANLVSMYRSLKFELLHVHHRILSIATYLRFISQLRVFSTHRAQLNTAVIDNSNEEQFWWERSLCGSTWKEWWRV